jgi:hypothetical protein
MGAVRGTGNNMLFRADNVRRAIATRSNWLGFVKFNHLPVIDICAESLFSSVFIGRKGIPVLCAVADIGELYQ